MASNTILIVTLMLLQLAFFANGQDATKFNGTCEFDLVDQLNDRDILKFLPEECKRVNDEERQAMKEESVKFKEFTERLSEKEKWNEQEKEVGRTTLDLDFEMRERVYNSTFGIFGNCSVDTDTTLDYVKCRTNYRQDLIDNINNESE